MPGEPPDPAAPKGGFGTTQYSGNAVDPTIRVKAPSGKGWGTAQRQRGQTTITAPGYKKGDQVTKLPKNGEPLRQLQIGLYQAGFLTDDQMKTKIVLGSPDDITTAAFAKLLATSNMSGTDWRTTLSTRLAAKGAEPEEEVDEVPPLTIDLSDPVAVKGTLQQTARKMLGGYMSDAQADAFVAQIQGQQTAAQTQAYYQQYDPASGGYGPGGTTTGAPTSQEEIGFAAENYAKATDPEQYKATQFGAEVTSALSKLRQTGYVS